MANITGKKVAFLATNGFEESELMETKRLIEEAGATTEIVSLEPGEIRGWKDKEWSKSVRVDRTVDQVSVGDYDSLIIPGGTMNPDILRTNARAVEFVKEFVESGKAVGAICHGPWMLVEANAVQGRRVTSWPSVKTDLQNAGARWSDAEVVTDQGIVTSRKPADIPAFARKMTEETAEGRHTRRDTRAVSII